MATINNSAVAASSKSEMRKLAKFIEVYNANSSAGLSAEEIMSKVRAAYGSPLSEYSYSRMLKVAKSLTNEGVMPSNTEWTDIRQNFIDIGNQKKDAASKKLSNARKKRDQIPAIKDQNGNTITINKARQNAEESEEKVQRAKTARILTIVGLSIAAAILLPALLSVVAPTFMAAAGASTLAGIGGLVLGGAVANSATKVLVTKAQDNRDKAEKVVEDNQELIDQIEREVAEAEAEVSEVEEQYEIDLDEEIAHRMAEDTSELEAELTDEAEDADEDEVVDEDTSETEAEVTDEDETEVEETDEDEVTDEAEVTDGDTVAEHTEVEGAGDAHEEPIEEKVGEETVAWTAPDAREVDKCVRWVTSRTEQIAKAENDFAPDSKKIDATTLKTEIENAETAILNDSLSDEERASAWKALRIRTASARFSLDIRSRSRELDYQLLDKKIDRKSNFHEIRAAAGIAMTEIESAGIERADGSICEPFGPEMETACGLLDIEETYAKLLFAIEAASADGSKEGKARLKELRRHEKAMAGIVKQVLKAPNQDKKGRHVRLEAILQAKNGAMAEVTAGLVEFDKYMQEINATTVDKGPEGETAAGDTPEPAAAAGETPEPAAAAEDTVITRVSSDALQEVREEVAPEKKPKEKIAQVTEPTPDEQIKSIKDKCKIGVLIGATTPLETSGTVADQAAKNKLQELLALQDQIDGVATIEDANALLDQIKSATAGLKVSSMRGRAETQMRTQHPASTKLEDRKKEYAQLMADEHPDHLGYKDKAVKGKFVRLDRVEDTSKRVTITSENHAEVVEVLDTLLQVNARADLLKQPGGITSIKGDVHDTLKGNVEILANSVAEYETETEMSDPQIMERLAKVDESTLTEEQKEIFKKQQEFLKSHQTEEEATV